MSKATAWDQIKHRAKALVAGLGTLAVSELLTLLLDQSFQDQVKAVAAPAWAPYVPIVFAVFVGLLTHGVANKPLPDQPAGQD